MNDARGPQRCRRRGPGLRHACRGIDVLFAKENGKFSADAPEGGSDRSTAMAAVTKATESDREARQMSTRVWCGRCPSLKPVQLCWSYFGGNVGVSQWFLGHVQVWIYSARSPCKYHAARNRFERFSVFFFGINQQRR